MKKFLALFLAIIMVTAITGCSAVVLDNKNTPELSRGKIDGDVYKNEYLGFEFTKPASWVYSTDEEIAAAVNIAVDNLLGDKFKDALENSTSIYDMMVVDSITATNINVVYENLKKSFSSNITVEQYVEALKNQLSSMTEMTVTFPDKLEDVKLGGVDFKKCVCTTTVYGINMTQVYYLHKIDGYMVSVILTITSGYTVADVEAMFK